MEQGTDEWIKARLGNVTASRVADIIAKTKSGYSTSRANYMSELIVERLTGEPQDAGYRTPAMQWGLDKEPEARAFYSLTTGNDVETVGYVEHPTISGAGASPDGLIGNDGLIEIKCPITTTHLATLEDGTVPQKYQTQIQWQLACTGRAWCDYVSYDPRLPVPMRGFITRVHHDEEKSASLDAEVRKFLAELEAKLTRLKEGFLNDAI